MIFLNIQRVMRLRGVDNYYKKLVSMGFQGMTARRLLDGELVRLDFAYLEKICLEFNCTPNDILEWRPQENLQNADEKALAKLKRGANGDISKILSTLPIEKIEQIADIMLDLNKD